LGVRSEVPRSRKMKTSRGREWIQWRWVSPPQQTRELPQHGPGPKTVLVHYQVKSAHHMAKLENDRCEYRTWNIGKIGRPPAGLDIASTTLLTSRSTFLPYYAQIVVKLSKHNVRIFLTGCIRALHVRQVRRTFDIRYSTMERRT